MSKLQPSPEPAGEPQVLVRPARERGRERKREFAWKQPQNKAERSLVGFCFLSPPNLLSSFLRHPEQLPPVAGAFEEQDAGLRRLAFQDDRPGPSAARGDPAPGRYGSTAAAGSPRPRRSASAKRTRARTRAARQSAANAPLREGARHYGPRRSTVYPRASGAQHPGRAGSSPTRDPESADAAGTPEADSPVDSGLSTRLTRCKTTDSDRALHEALRRLTATAAQLQRAVECLEVVVQHRTAPTRSAARAEPDRPAPLRAKRRIRKLERPRKPSRTGPHAANSDGRADRADRG
eukprot:SAG31_NODE_1435_length_8356_cov_148.657503_6_plen_293_part_00